MKRITWMLMVGLIIGMMVSAKTYAYQREKSRSEEAAAEAEKKDRISNHEKYEVAIYSNDVAAQPYVVIGNLSYREGTVFGSCDKKLAKFARKKYGADAMLNFKMINGYFCEGVAVRWAQVGENGLTRIGENTPIPYIKGRN